MTARRRWGGTSPLPTAGTTRATTRVSAISGSPGRRSSRPGCGSPAATLSSACGRSPTPAVTPSCPLTTTHRRRSPSPSPALTWRLIDRSPTSRSTASACRTMRWCCRSAIGRPSRSPSPTAGMARRRCRRASQAPRPSPAAGRPGSTQPAASTSPRLPWSKRSAPRGARCCWPGPPTPRPSPSATCWGSASSSRLGDLDDRQVIEIAPSIAAAVAVTARRGHQLAPAALDAAAVALAVAGERRALSDLARVRDSVGLDDRPNAIVEMAEATGDIAIVPTVERRLLAGSTLFPTGIPDRWRGVDFEAHRLVAGPASTLSLAVRWHGNNAAVLWEVAGEPITLSASVGASRWSSAARRGEALWRLGEPSTL